MNDNESLYMGENPTENRDGVFHGYENHEHLLYRAG